jgi:hypothetical protein
MKKLSGKQLTAIEMLAGGRAEIETARTAGVSRITISRWMRDADFVALIKQRESERVADLGKRITALATKALDTLEGVIDSPTSRPDIRVRASSIILSNWQSVRELAELEARIARLENEVL